MIFSIFSIFKASDVPSILDLVIFIKMDASWNDLGKKLSKSVIGAHMKGGVLYGGGRFQPPVIAYSA